MGKAVTAVIIVVVLALVGFGFYVYNDNSAVTTTATNSSPTPATFVVASSSPNTNQSQLATSAYSSGSTYTAPTTPASPAPTYTAPASTVTNTSRTTTTYRAPATTIRRVTPINGYHNSTFGLTVPGSYTVAQSAAVYGGVPTSSSLIFYYRGVPAFQINVWSRENWSKLRNEETWNEHDGNIAGTYFGEGTYLGENFTWIYSVLPLNYAPPTGIVFY